jgi:hypothetical protein
VCVCRKKISKTFADDAFCYYLFWNHQYCTSCFFEILVLLVVIIIIHPPIMVNIAGFDTCQGFQKACTALNGLAVLFPNEITVELTSFPTSAEYNIWLEANRSRIGAPSHTGSPFVWFEDGAVLGGLEDTLKWCRTTLSTGHVTPVHPVVNVDPWDHNVMLK